MLGNVLRGLSKNVFGGQTTGSTSPIGRKSPIELATSSKEEKLKCLKKKSLKKSLS